MSLFVYYIDVRKVLKAGAFQLDAKWYQLGLALGVKNFKLDQIRVNNIGDARACLTATLQTWIDTGSATVEKLVDVVADPTSIDNKNLAREIKKYFNE